MHPIRSERAPMITMLFALVAFQALAIIGATSVSAVTDCTFDLGSGRIECTIDPGDDLGLAVETAAANLDALAPPGAILQQVNAGAWEAIGSANNANTTNISVLGFDGSDETFTIDNNVGDADTSAEFSTAITWAVNMGTNTVPPAPGDIFIINLALGADTVELTNTSFTINGGGGPVAGVDVFDVFGNTGDDTIDASALTTRAELFGLAGVDTLSGGAADDRISGGDGNDRLLGKSGDDELDGGENVDRLYGGDGINDRCLLGGTFATCEPSISVAFPTVGGGDSLTVNGAGWYVENGDVELFLEPLDGGVPEPLTPLTPNPEDWTVRGSITAPTSAGEYTLLACQPCSDLDREERTASFTVDGARTEPAISVDHTSVVPGSTIRVRGERWDPQDGPISLSTDLPGFAPGESFDTVTAETDGTFDSELEVGDAPVGSYVITACQLCDAAEPIEQTASFTVETGSTPSLELRPPTGAPGDSIDAVGQGWDPDGGRVRLFVDPSTPRGNPDAVARVDPNGAFVESVTVPALDAGTYTIIACQHCNAPDGAVSATLTVTAIPPPPEDGSVWPWVLAGAAALLIVVAAGVAAVRALRPKPLPGAPEIRLSTDEPTVTLVAEDDGRPTQEIRLIPHPDPGVQRVLERSER